MITANITVNLSGEPQLIKVPAKQGDVGSREVSIKFVDNGVFYTIPEGTTARIRVTKPDGKYVFNDCEIESNAVIAPLTAQTLAAAGDARADIALYQGENVLLSCSVFILAIMPRAGSDSAIESTDEFGTLDSLLQQAETDIPAAHDAAQAANTAAGAANTAAEAANDAAEAANTAKDGADDAANAANTAAGTANMAAEAANSAAQTANTAKEGADSAAQAANTAAGAANTAAGAANDAAQAANDIATEVEEKLENGDFVGPPGNLDNVTGAATSILVDNLDTNRALVSDGNGKVAVSAVTSTELGYLDGVTSGIQGQLNGKQSAVTGAASTITENNLTASRALVSDGSGKVAVSAVTSTELGYLDGVTSGIQGQLNGKQGTITGAASTITGSNLTANRALVSDGSGKVAVSAVTSTELGYLDGLTGGIQWQINGLSNNLKTPQYGDVSGSAADVSAGSTTTKTICTCQKTGTVFIWARCAYPSDYGNNRQMVTVNKNGTEIAREDGILYISGISIRREVSTFVKCVPGDTITVSALNQAGSGKRLTFDWRYAVIGT